MKKGRLKRQPLSCAPIVEAHSQVNLPASPDSSALRIASRLFAERRCNAQSVQRPAFGCQRLNFTYRRLAHMLRLEDQRQTNSGNDDATWARDGPHQRRHHQHEDADRK